MRELWLTDRDVEKPHRSISKILIDPTSAVSVPGPGLGRIFDVSSGDTSLSTTPPQSNFLTGSLSSPTDSLPDGGFWQGPASGQTKETDLDITSKDLPTPPNDVDVISVSRLDTSDAAATIRHREAMRKSSRWLVVHVRGTTTVIIFLPRQLSTPKSSSLSKSMLTSCMEWLETLGMSQILVAVNKALLGENPLGSSVYKSLLFLGFSTLPSWIVAEQLPYLGESFSWLVTDLIDC
ncbi:unnamed protein product [Dibothriocephalus latus]|uniref:Uncharacterized protein n=1 Tax=Dibothriocephalus latus TaxID=60516 RepID=A0A3P7MTS7_DIBLA|nr:unnamed protein product [Dibothriocephalus latus]